MKKWKTELTSRGQRLGVVDINRGIFQGDSLSRLLFVLCMVPISLVLRRSGAGYDIGMKFGIKKCGVLILKRGKIVKMEGVVLPDVQVMKEIDERGYRYLGVLKSDQLKEKEIKDLIAKEYKVNVG